MLHMLYIATFFPAALVGAVLLVLWLAIEVIGYGGMLVGFAILRGWIVPASDSRRIRKARDVRWGVVVRAAGLRPRTS